MSRKFLDPWVYDMFLGMGRFEPIPAQNKTWVAGLFLEPLPSMLTSEPLIAMDLLEHLARAGARVADLSLPHYK